MTSTFGPERRPDVGERAERAVKSEHEESMTKPAGSFNLHIDHVDGFEFRVHFDRPALQDLSVDEPPPLGRDQGPNPARLLAAALGSCLSASLLFCLRRAKVPVSDLKSDVEVQLVRNERNRLRLGRVKVNLYPELEPSIDFRNCLEQFEDFCVVTQSVREGIDVEVEVHSETGAGKDELSSESDTAPG